MDLQTVSQILLRRLWIILLVPILAVALIWAVDSNATQVYRSDVRLLIYADKAQLSGRDLIYGYYSLDQASIVATFVEIANSRRILIDTLSALNLGGEQADLIGMTTVALPNSTVLELSARAPNPSLAQQVANTAGEKIVSFVQQYYSGYTIEVIDPAYLPNIPIEPNLLRDAAVALALGLVLGGVLATGDYYLHQWMGQSKKRPVYDADSLALTRSYLEGRLSKMSEAELQESGLAIIQLGGLRGAKDRLSLKISRQIQRAAVERMFGELRGKDLAARWSDSSFAIFMPNITGEAAERLLGGVQAALEEPLDVEALERPFPLDPRIGAVTSGRGIRPLAMIQEAEAALKKASSNGSHPVVTAIEFSEPWISSK